MFWNYFKYQNPSFSAKDLIRAKQGKNDQLLNNTNDELMDLRNAINEKEIPEKDNPNKIVHIAGRIIYFNKQQRGKGIKTLTPKQII